MYLHQALTVVNVGATEASLRQSECSDTGSSTAGGKQGDSSTSVDPDDLSDPIQTHAECCWLAGGVLSSVLSHMCETDQDQAGCWLLCKNIFKKRLSCSLTHCSVFLTDWRTGLKMCISLKAEWQLEQRFSFINSICFQISVTYSRATETYSVSLRITSELPASLCIPLKAAGEQMKVRVTEAGAVCWKAMNYLTWAPRLEECMEAATERLTMMVGLVNVRYCWFIADTLLLSVSCS